MTELSIRSRVRLLQVSTGSSDPRELAEKLMSELGSDEYPSALSEVLPEYVRQVMTAGRRSATASPPKSTKVAAVRSWHEQLMSQPIDVSGGRGSWKALRDCTRDELLSVARFRRENAARSVATAEKYEALAKMMVNKRTVGELSADIVAGVFGKAAA